MDLDEYLVNCRIKKCKPLVSIDCAVREEHSLLATAFLIDSVIGIDHVYQF